MKWLTAAALPLCAALLVGCGSTAEHSTTSATEPPTTVAPTATDPAPTTSAPALAASTVTYGHGSPEVYAKIAARTNCAELQADFDRADINRKAALNRKNVKLADVSLSYMQAALARRKELGCHS